MGSRPTEHVETELKFEVSGDFVLPDLGSPALGGAALSGAAWPGAGTGTAS